jgi:hypothetical protein
MIPSRARARADTCTAHEYLLNLIANTIGGIPVKEPWNLEQRVSPDVATFGTMQTYCPIDYYDHFASNFANQIRGVTRSN